MCRGFQLVGQSARQVREEFGPTGLATIWQFVASCVPPWASPEEYRHVWSWSSEEPKETRPVVCEAKPPLRKASRLAMTRRESGVVMVDFPGKPPGAFVILAETGEG